MSGEAAVKAQIAKFVRKSLQNIDELTAEELVQDAAINPFLVKALGISDFDALARFYVYQRVGRSIVTSFGTVIEKMVEALAGGTGGTWWDVVTDIGGTRYYMSVKSGPRDMDKDQVQHFAQRARELLQSEPNAHPIIAMGYGKGPMGVIPPTLRNEGLDPDRHTLTGKKLYDTITGVPDYHKKLLQLTSEAAVQTLGGRKVIEIIENKVGEIADSFRRHYRTVDELLLDTF
jgi:hypothetical protein